MEKREKAFISGEIKAVLKNVSRTLYLSVNVLPEPVRTSMGLGYLLCRAMDTVADSPSIGPSEKLELLALMRGLDKPGSAAEVGRRAGALVAGAQTKGEKELLLRFGKVLELYARLPEGDRKLFPELLDAIASGMETDVRSFPGGAPAALKAPQDLELYCSRIGGAPGTFWARLYREAIRLSTRAKDDFPSESDAAMIGSALQITNILKDLAADLRIGRCYLPQSDLDSAGLKPADLLDQANMPRLWETVARWIGWAVDRLDQSEAFLTAIPKTELALRAAVIWPVYWAMDTLEQVAHSNVLDPAARPRIRRGRVYSTIASTPPLLLSNTAFARGYRFRRETLIVSINRGLFQEGA